MVSSHERRALIETYSQPVHARAAVAKAIAGLLSVIGIAALGASYLDDAPSHATALSAQQGATGR